MKKHTRYDEAARVLMELLGGDDHDDSWSPRRGKWYVDCIIPEICKIADDATSIGRILAKLRREGLDIDTAVRDHVNRHPGCRMAAFDRLASVPPQECQAPRPRRVIPISPDAVVSCIKGKPGLQATFRDLASSFVRRKADRIQLHAVLGDLAGRGVIRRERRVYLLSNRRRAA